MPGASTDGICGTTARVCLLFNTLVNNIQSNGPMGLPKQRSGQWPGSRCVFRDLIKKFLHGPSQPDIISSQFLKHHSASINTNAKSKTLSFQT